MPVAASLHTTPRGELKQPDKQDVFTVYGKR